MLKRLARAAYARLPFKRQLFNLIRHLGLPKSMHQHLHFRGPFTTYLGFRMVAQGEVVENELFWGGDWERQSLRLWCEHSRNSQVIIDIGANTGVYALAAKAANPAAMVIAFEPIKRIAQRLADNVALNGFDIRIEELAISDSSGTATIHDVDEGMNYSASLEDTSVGNTSSYAVETSTLDAYLAALDWPEVGLLKIDVETHEPAVFGGMQETIQRFRPTIFVEVLTEEIGRQLELPGYSYFAIDEANGLIPVQSPRPLGGRNWNNLLIPDRTPAD